MTDLLETPDALRKLREADALLAEGVQRIMGVATDLPGTSQPLQEALRLSEEQAMVTMDAAESAQRQIQAIEETAIAGGFIDGQLDAIKNNLQTILTSQQGQDLAGQRLKKTITLLQAVETRIQEALEQLGCLRDQSARAEDTFTGQRLDQANVDDLLAQLGI
ncbi:MULTISPECIES: chemotaxis protein CheZ [unclassified Thiomonas]|uniref:chemotaxis protein CheZ n=1 Tax=unclassified Thiomonas TaxID=2625466 RepID=UPI0004DBA900|nr:MULTISPECIES: chemotaxis protein CheZ [unclassified Thiomonas]CDW95011.1 putative Chemotaxis protein cheZ [Thiomonas sp. CB2]VDY03926.1 putative Chemotaxis protein cheZ [Thiomonas sp. Bio17B3]VDY08902.1 putative Chemotaxis protein cheZ [Thiomonas sp. Sup16B3]VDY12172.1 putative Chemotaxis protein cheZ [Thiomonas sp. OC7]VDY18613.1 putative Chemotaxis protein cheZ [Thiomonas sp. CB2]